MNIVENFAELSVEEQKSFATALVQKINAEHIFSSDVDFSVEAVEAIEITGDLAITLKHDEPVKVPRAAAWTASSDDDITDAPYDADYENSVFDEAEKAFKTMSADIDGYKVSLEIDDIDEDAVAEVIIDSYSHEDAGIGSYEFWGDRGFDSRPYLAVEGTIVSECTCYMTLYVEPADNGLNQ